MKAVHAKRLLNVARALRESPAPKRFCMTQYGYCDPDGDDSDSTCGTPACALGHYAARTDLQRLLTLTEYGTLRYRDRRHPASYGDDSVLEHFGIGETEAMNLFAGWGCGNAKTPKAAAKWIEKFVDERRA